MVKKKGEKKEIHSFNSFTYVYLLNCQFLMTMTIALTNIVINIRMELLARTVPASNLLLAGTVPASNLLLVPSKTLLVPLWSHYGTLGYDFEAQ